MTSLSERFWSKVDMSAGPDGCWLWTGQRKQGADYGQMAVKRPDGTWRAVRAHRVAWELLCGPIPEGLHVDHLCRVRACVNPAHLEPVTQRVNTLRGEAPAAQRARQTHCIHGHAFTEENTYVRPNGRQRACRACQRERYVPRQRERRTYCARGHAMTPENTYVPPSRPTERHCRACRREAGQRAIARRRLQRLQAERSSPEVGDPTSAA